MYRLCHQHPSVSLKPSTMLQTTDSAGQSDYEATSRETLLDVILDKLQKTGKTAIVSRLIYVARFTRREQNVDNQKAFYTKLFETHDLAGNVTGMLVLFPSCLIHMIEVRMEGHHCDLYPLFDRISDARTDTIMMLLRDVLTADPLDSKIAEARVISSTEDIPYRCYNSWYASFINTNSTADQMDPADSTTIVRNASDINQFLRKIGPTLVGQADNEIRRRLTSLESYYEDVPSPELVLSLTPSEDAPTLEEYLDMFDSPINVDLDSEQVWPMPVPLKL